MVDHRGRVKRVDCPDRPSIWDADGTLNTYLYRELAFHLRDCPACRPRLVETVNLPEFEND